MIIKMASTAMTKFLSKLDESSFVRKAEQFVDLMHSGKIPKREMLIKRLGNGASQQADLVIHPKFGPSVRKYFHTSALTPEAFEVQNKFLRHVTKEHPKSFAKLKGFEREATPQQKSYFEFVPGEFASTGVNISKRRQWGKKLEKMYNETYGERDFLEEMDRFDDAAKDKWFPKIQKLDRMRTNNERKRHQGRLAPILPEPLKEDIDRLRPKYELFDVATDNVKGGKIIDAEPAYSHFPSIIKYKAISKENKPILKHLLGYHDYGSQPVPVIRRIKTFTIKAPIAPSAIAPEPPITTLKTAPVPSRSKDSNTKLYAMGGGIGLASIGGVATHRHLTKKKKAKLVKTAAKGDILNAFMKEKGVRAGADSLIKRFGVNQTLGAMKNLNNLNKTKFLDRTKSLLGAV